jgi:hypothetical protein
MTVQALQLLFFELCKKRRLEAECSDGPGTAGAFVARGIVWSNIACSQLREPTV